jgi:hypothetical protein
MEIVPDIRRVEIGGTWYGRRWQRTHVNTACKWLLLEHAFDVLQCTVVGWRTDVLNLASQAAIERLGATKDGTIRRQRLRRDGTIRDAVVYSLIAEEWPSHARERLRRRLRAAAGPAGHLPQPASRDAGRPEEIGGDDDVRRPCRRIPGE